MIYSKVKICELEGQLRLDPEYYDPRLIALGARLDGALDLGDVVDVVVGATVNEFDDVGDVLYVKAGDFGEDGVCYKGCLRLREVGFGMVEARSGDVVLTRKGKIGGVDIVPNDLGFRVVVSSEVMVLRVKDEELIDSVYLALFLESDIGQAQMARLASGTFIKSIALSELRTMKVFKHGEYDLIVRTGREFMECLGKFRRMYEQGRKEMEKGFDLKRGLNQSGGFLVKVSEVRKTGSLDVKLFEGGEEVIGIELGDIADFEIGDDVGADNYCEEGCEFIRVGNVGEFGFLGKDQKYVSEELFRELDGRHKIKKGDVLMTKDGSPGVAFVVSVEKEGMLSGGIVRIILRDDQYDAYFVSLAINSRFGQRQVARFVSGANIRHLKMGDIRRIKIPRMNGDEMRVIVGLVREALDNREKSFLIKNELIEKIKL